VYPINRHYEAIKYVCKTLAKAPQEALIKEINPIIRGRSNYYAYSDAGTNGKFGKLSNVTFTYLLRWAKGNSITGHDTHKYWHKDAKDNWVFGIRNEKGEVWMRLLKHGEEHGAS